MLSQKINSANKQSGSALLEVMISMVVLIVGVMAFVKLQHMGVKRTHDNRLRAEAVKVVNQLAETMRVVDIAALPPGAYLNPNQLGLGQWVDCSGNVVCNGQQVMHYKLDQALREMTGFNGNGQPNVPGFVPVNRVGVCVNYNNANTYAQIDFLWKNPTDNDDLVAGDCPNTFGNLPAPTANQSFSFVSTVTSL